MSKDAIEGETPRDPSRVSIRLSRLTHPAEEGPHVSSGHGIEGILLISRLDKLARGDGLMKDGMALFSAALILMTFASNSAREGTTTDRDMVSSPYEVSSGVDDPSPLSLESHAKPSTEIGPLGLSSKAQIIDARDIAKLSDTAEIIAKKPCPPPEPASMGLFGIGITGLITLRRFRRYFF